MFAFGLSRDDPKLVGRGRYVVPGSLRIRGTRVTWRDGKRRRSARLG